MENISLQFINNTKVRVICPDDINRELTSLYSFYIPKHKFHPLVKAKKWNGKIYLFNSKQSTIPVGLVPDLTKYLSENGYNISISQEVAECFNDDSINHQWFKSFIESFPVTADGVEITPRDYQLRMTYLAAKHKRAVFLSATATGKSMSQYLITRFLQDKIKENILIIVPNIGLVYQLKSDFEDYSGKDEGWFINDNVEMMCEGSRYSGKSQVLISTWQSLIPITKNKDMAGWFDQFGAVMCDEVHGAKGESIQAIMNCCVNASYRIGLTGTLDGEETNLMIIKSAFGPIIQIQTAKQAMDAGHIAKAKIECIELLYPEETKDATFDLKYQDELAYIFESEKRNNLIVNLVKGLEGNTIILVARREHGAILVSLLEENLVDRNVYYINGDVEGEDRDELRAIIEKEDNSVVVGTYGCIQTGTNIKRIHNAIFASPSKSVIRVLQSIGRGLRLAKDKFKFTMYDLIDNFGHDEKNYCMEHSEHRFGYYAEQEFDFRVIRLKL